MMTARQAWNTGWRLTGVVGTAVTALALTAFVLTPDPVEGTRLAIRLTARTSLALFLLAFTASALVRLRPSPFTHWLRANRRYVGVSFAVSHAVHLAAVIALALIVAQPDLGQTVSLGIILLALLWYAGLPLRVFAASLLAVLLAGGVVAFAGHDGWSLWGRDPAARAAQVRHALGDPAEIVVTPASDGTSRVSGYVPT